MMPQQRTLALASASAVLRHWISSALLASSLMASTMRGSGERGGGEGGGGEGGGGKGGGGEGGVHGVLVQMRSES